MNASCAPSPDIVRETGPAFVGHLLHWGFFGILTTQVYMYYLAFPKDPVKNKLFVYLTYALAIIQTGTMARDGYLIYGSGYGDPQNFDIIRLTWLIIPLLTGIIAFVSQIFYAYRVSVLSKTHWVSAVIVFLALVQLGGAIASTVVMKNAGNYARLMPEFPITASVWAGGSALCDVVIAVSMTYYLTRGFSRGTKATQGMLKKVITLVIETGTATATVAVLSLALMDAPIKTMLYQIPGQILAGTYANSMMALLNSRMTIRAHLADATMTAIRFDFGQSEKDTQIIGDVREVDRSQESEDSGSTG